MATNQNAQNTAPATARSAVAPGLVVQGKTVIDDSVVAKVAGIAVRDIPGVYALGGGVARMVGAVRDAVGNTDLAQGVTVEVGETQVAADISLVAEYPVPLQELGDRVREAVAKAVTELVGMEIAEVNVTVSDVHVPSDDDGHDADETAGHEGEARVR